MRREAALQPLSRDHHVALEVALRLRRDEAGAAERFLLFWQDAGRHHFHVEEDLIFPVLDDGAEEVQRAVREHAAIRRRAHQLAHGDAVDTIALGELLNEHVRFEERVLFGLVEEALDAAGLEALGAAVEAA
ncbi:MAG: hemerythrin domain-containing protein [Solirubrobacterales bacterium]|nr:hemerythrin domain-containing protein [Solirubrobacterales bacterium]